MSNADASSVSGAGNSLQNLTLPENMAYTREMEIRHFPRRDLLKMLLIIELEEPGWGGLPFSYIEICAEVARRDKRR